MTGTRAPITNNQADRQSGCAPIKLLFLHIPKAGGTSLSDWIFLSTRRIDGPSRGRWLQDGVFYYPSGFVRGPYAKDRRIIRETFENINVHAILGHFYFGVHDRLKEPFTYVIMLRDPMQRTISLYYFQRLVEKRQVSHQGVTLPKNMGLEEFVKNPPYAGVDNGQTRRIAGVDAVRSRCPRGALEIAKKNIVRHFCLAGVLNRFDESLVLLARKLKWSNRFVCYLQNENPGRPSPIDLPEQVLQAVRRRNELDIELYDSVLERFMSEIDSGGAEFQQQLGQYKEDCSEQSRATSGE